MQMDFSGKTAILTGASRGIGRAIALRLGRSGAHVVLSARHPGSLSESLAEIQAAGGTACALPPS